MGLDFSSIRAVLFDMDGVLYRGPRILPGANDLLAFLDQRGIAYSCITNNSTRTPAQIAGALQERGLHMPAERIMTSATATALHLRSIAPRGTAVYPIGMQGLEEALFGDDYFTLDATMPRYVVVGADFELTYAKLRVGCLAIRAGAEFIGTNPDTTFPAEDGIIPGCGAILAALEASTSRRPTIIGKPEPGMFTAAIQALGTRPDTTLVVGDRYDTDITGGARAGLATAMVLTGVSSRAEAEEGPVQPSAIFADLIALRASWQDALD